MDLQLTTEAAGVRDGDFELERLREENLRLRAQVGPAGLLQSQLQQLSERMDQELQHFEAIQNFIQRAVVAESIAEFGPIVCESMCELLECGGAIYWSLLEPAADGGRFYHAGLAPAADSPPAEMERWVAAWMAAAGKQGRDPHAAMPPLPAGLGLHGDFRVELVMDSTGLPLALLIAGHSGRQFLFCPGFGTPEDKLFVTFAKQVEVLIVSIRRRSTILSQIATIRTSEERLSTALGSGNVGLWDWDLIQDRVDYSDQWKSQLGLESGKVGDSPGEWRDRLHPDDREHAIEVVRACALAPRSNFDLTVRMRVKDDRWLWINTRGINVSTDDGTVRRLIGTHLDVTGFKALENRLLKAEKEQRVAREQADRENLAKTSFLAAVSHEIRTPLNGMLGVFQMLRLAQQPDREQLAKLIEMGESSGKWMLRLIGESLDIARIEAGKLELNPEVVALPALLEELKSLKSSRAANLGLELRWQTAAALPQSILVDGVRLRQVLTNLLANAFKFTHEGFVALETSVIKYGRSGTLHLRFVVADSGIGFTREFGRVIFEPFTQGAERSHSSDHGIGMGLVIIKQLVALMGGRIEVSSRPGVGSRFTVTVPVKDLSGVAVESAHPPSAVVPSFRGSVLVVDDDYASGEVARLMLAELGFQVDLARDGGEGLTMAIAGYYDLIFMDCWMPVMRGTDAVRELRASATALSRNVPIIALTANARESDAADCRQSGMNDILVKPLLWDGLIEKVVRYLPVATPTRFS